MNDLEQRAVKIFGAYEGRPAWPYGLGDPEHRLRPGDDPEVWKRQRFEQPQAQRIIVEWAERYGLRANDKACCPRWLQKQMSQRCFSVKCTNYGTMQDHAWMDHPIGWTLDRRPVAITSSPYGLSDSHEFLLPGHTQTDMERLRGWPEEDDRLKVAIGGIGWYGSGTTQVVMWRSDRIEVMEPAPNLPEYEPTRG